MRTKLAVSFGLLVVALACVGCSDDTTGTGGTGGMGGSAGGAGGAAGSTGGNGGEGGSVLPTACTDLPDLDVVTASNFSSNYAFCATRMIGDADATSECLQEELGLSPDCSDCYGTYAECVEVDCEACNPFDAACERCLIDECGRPFFDCAGFRFPAP